MLSIRLSPQDEYQWIGENPSEKTFPSADNRNPLYHQHRTCHAKEPVIVNTHNTGTGKTLAALLRLLKRCKGKTLVPSHDNVLLIAPTNELLIQHEQDACTFCEQNELPYRVLTITREHLEDYRTRPDFAEEQVRRRGAVLYTLLNDAAKVDNSLKHEATIYVVNPDIFYYVLYFHYYTRFDREALFKQFLDGFNYLIIDEFHYYDAKQFAAFLFFIQLSKHYDYIKSSKERQFCILTATPNGQVKTYLNRLELPIAWIEPGEIAEEDVPYVRPVRALAPVTLHVFYKDELKNAPTDDGNLLRLVERMSASIAQRLTYSDDDGAIISGSLGMVNRIYEALQRLDSSDTPLATMMGRVTGAQERENRQHAKYQRLILATPTVDIGYNFERHPDAPVKPRQNIDFLLLDAATGDELIQRIGRAGRVLSKPERDHASSVYVVVEPKMYEVLKSYDGVELDRPTLAQLAREHMPKRNDIYAYIASGSVLEVARPMGFLFKGTADEGNEDLEQFLRDIQHLFGVKRPYTYKRLKGLMKRFEQQTNAYASLRTIPQDTMETFLFMLKNKLSLDDLSASDATKRCIKAFKIRLGTLSKDDELFEMRGKRPREVIDWFQQDLRAYAIDNARFSFRDSFQPPLALIYDPEHLHSDSTLTQYNALHLIRYYHVSCMDEAAFEVYLQQHGLHMTKQQRNTSAVYCELRRFRETPLQLQLRLDARDAIASEWDMTYTHRVTALHGLEIVPTSDHSSNLTLEIRNLLRDQYIPAFLVTQDGKSAGLMLALKREARFFAQTLEVTFEDDRESSYLAVLGNMAFQVCAELLNRAPNQMRMGAQEKRLHDDEPFIC